MLVIVSVSDVVSLPLDKLRELLSTTSGYSTALLQYRVRNTSNIAKSVPQDVREQYSDSDGYNASTVIPVASSHTVPGHRPVAVLTNMR